MSVMASFNSYFVRQQFCLNFATAVRCSLQHKSCELDFLAVRVGVVIYSDKTFTNE